jgi:hypothetical protein
MASNNHKGHVVSATSVPSLESIEINRLPTGDDIEPSSGIERRSTFHVYQKHECHKCISPTTDPSKESRSGPTIKQRKRSVKRRRNVRLLACLASNLMRTRSSYIDRILPSMSRLVHSIWVTASVTRSLLFSSMKDAFGGSTNCS